MDQWLDGIGRKSQSAMVLSNVQEIGEMKLPVISRQSPVF